jgi:hypothetical protein
MSNRGYLPHKVIKGFVFWILSVCIAVFTMAGILQSWNAIGDLAASRCMWTAFMLSLGSVAFLIINYLFGDLEQFFLGRNEQAPRVDPAFTDALRRAKAEGRGGD